MSARSGRRSIRFQGVSGRGLALAAHYGKERSKKRERSKYRS